MHNKFTIVTQLRPDRHRIVREMLSGQEFVAPDADDDLFGFSQIKTLHFSSLCLYDDPEDGWSLVWEHNIDGDIDSHLEATIAVARDLDDGAFLLDLYRHAAAFYGTTLNDLRRFLRAHVVMPQAGFISAVGLKRDQIRLDAKIHEVVDETLGAAGVPHAPARAQQMVLEALDANPETQGLWHHRKDPGTGLTLKNAIKGLATLALNGIGFLVLAVVNLIPERAARQDQATPDPQMRQAMERGEDFIPTNHMISVVHVHTDPGRQLAKRTGFGLLRALVALIYRHSYLGSIDTIHFAHWSFVNNNRRLLFVSNYDGSWRSYLDDFTLKASNGLNLAWAHSTGFPKTWAMLLGGASMGPEFIDFARRSMSPTLVWYSAYPSVSVTNIARNRDLRRALVRARAGSTDTSWLELV